MTPATGLRKAEPMRDWRRAAAGHVGLLVAMTLLSACGDTEFRLGR